MPVDLETGTVGSKWQASGFESIYAALEYLRLYDRDVVITSKTEVFDAQSASLLATFRDPFLDHVVGASKDGKSVFTVPAGLSGVLDLQRHTIECSSISGACTVTKRESLSRAFANVRDIAVSNDGTTIHTAAGGEYQFPTFVLSGGAIVEGAALAGGPYPMAAEMGPRGKFYGGRDWASTIEPDAIDVWSYAVNGEPQDTYVLPGHVSARQLQVSGDGLRLIALTPTLVLSPTGP